MDHTVHVVDALRWMTGKEFTKVYCDCGTVLHRGLRTDDVGSLHLEMENGVIVSHVATSTISTNLPTRFVVVNSVRYVRSERMPSLVRGRRMPGRW